MNDPKKISPAAVAEQFRKVAEAAKETGDALKAVKAQDKKPYVPAPHLTHKPFRDNAALREMQDKLRIQEGRRNRNPKPKRQR